MTEKGPNFTEKETNQSPQVDNLSIKNSPETNQNQSIFVAVRNAMQGARTKNRNRVYFEEI